MSIVVKTTDIKFTISEYEYEDNFLKNVGNRVLAYPNSIAGIIMKEKYRLPPVVVVKEDGKKSWKAKPVEDNAFMSVLHHFGANGGEFVVTHGGPLASEAHMTAITGEQGYRVLQFNVYNTSLGLVALVTQTNSQ